MSKKVFLGKKNILPAAIARKLLEYSDGPLLNLRKIILVLPGALAKKEVVNSLLEIVPQGMLTPQILTPSQLLHFNTPNKNIPSTFIEELIWTETIRIASETPQKFNAVFPDGKFPPDKQLASGKLQAFRNEVSKGGFSIAEIAGHLGLRGTQLAMLEEIFLKKLNEYGFSDPLQVDREAVTDNEVFADFDKIIVAGIPDLPNMLRNKLRQIDLIYPDMVELWLHADESDEDAFDAWGTPQEELWEKRAVEIPESSLINAYDPDDAARISAKIVAENGGFSPDDFSIVLSNPSLFAAFSREFSKFITPDGTPLPIIDPSGIPFGDLRIFPSGQNLIDFLKNDNDFLYVLQLLKGKDFLDRICGDAKCSSSTFLSVLDDFCLAYTPDNFDTVLEICEKRNISLLLKNAFAELASLKKLFYSETLPVFIRRFLTWLYEKNPDAESETVRNIPFSTEVDFLKKQLEELDSTPVTLIEKSGNLKALEIFWRALGKRKIAMSENGNAFPVEGCLEIPFLRKAKVIFCGMNDSYFPDKIDLSPFLTDSLRQEIGLRSNRKTRLRALCHLHSLISPRVPGEVKLISLRRDSEKNLLRPSSLLFSGEIPGKILIDRCDKLFCDPAIHIEKSPVAPGEKVFRLHPQFSVPCAGNDENTPLLPVTFMDDYLSSPFGALISRFHSFNPENYSALEPDNKISGILYHKVFEALGSSFFNSEKELKNIIMQNLDRVIFEQFGPDPLPAFVSLQKENMRQRLEYAVPVLFNEQQKGFQVLAVEYRFGENNNNSIAFEGAIFKGTIDRIEYNKKHHLLRIIDIKTGKTDSVSKAHYYTRKKHSSDGETDTVFLKLQLPLYALLLQQDESFYQRFPQCRGAEIECGYLCLPQNVTDTELQMWDREDFDKILPHAQQKIREIIAELRQAKKQIIFENPDKFSGSKFKSLPEFFRPDLRNATTGICWQYEPSGKETKITNHDEPTEQICFTDYSPLRSEPATDTFSELNRFCDCPAEIHRKCSCEKISCSFHGFKSFNIITASAGTGKTYSLASRFIQLMHFGANPEEIMAVTFTKKAAGEIFDKIIARLLEMCKAGSNPANCCQQISQSESLRIIKNLLCSDKDLPISTFDSFFMRLIQAYAPEFGIWGEISMIDPGDNRMVKKTIRNWIKSFSGTDLQNTMRELLKDANSSELKNFAESINSLLDEVYNFYLLKVSKSSSGEMPQLTFHPWHPQVEDIIVPDKLDDICGKLYQYADIIKIDDCSNKTDQRSKNKHGCELSCLADFLQKTRFPFGKIPNEVNDLFKTLQKYNGNFWLNENDPVFFTKKLSSPPEISTLVCRAFRHIRALDYLRLRRKTAAVFELMKLFDQVYSSSVRAAGNLTFADLSYLLFSMSDETKEAILGSSDRSLEMRLDAKINHYLFDEFQDTSNLQYLAFDGILKEIFSSVPDKFRSFFCVGDKKQSIYQWRDGNPYLFDYLIKQLTPVAEERGYSPVDSLSKSYRSCQIVLDMVNMLFYPEYTGDIPFFESIRKEMDFKWHSSAVNKNGFAALIDQESGSIESKAGLIFEILKKQNPLQKNLSVGILVKKNRTAREFADAFSELVEKENLGHLFPVSIEGSISPCDSMAFNLYRSLITLALHPSDQTSQAFLTMLTFGEKNSHPEALTTEKLLKRMGFPENSDLSEAIRNDIFYNGISGNIDRFIKAFSGEWNNFDSKRISTMRETAENFRGTPEEFLEKLQWIKAEDAALKKTVQIMTVHKSKGLEFDIVFLPDTANQPGENNSLLPDTEIVDYSDVSFGDTLPESSWISYLPKSGIAAGIPPFQEHLDKQKKQEAFEKCCNLYVAMTRAAKALYIITSCGKTTSTLAPDMLLNEVFSQFGSQNCDRAWFRELYHNCRYPGKMSLIYSRGDNNFTEKEFPEKSEDSVIILDRIPRQIISMDTVSRKTASGEKSVPAADPAKRFQTSTGAAIGTTVHELLEKIDFLDDSFDAEKFCDLHLEHSVSSMTVRQIFCETFAPGKNIPALFTRPEGDFELWKEYRFILKTPEKTLIPGAFDRVIIHKENGRFIRAEIIDYKTDRLEKAEDFKIYENQMLYYRKSLSSITGLPEDKIKCIICSLHLDQILTF